MENSWFEMYMMFKFYTEIVLLIIFCSRCVNVVTLATI